MAGGSPHTIKVNRAPVLTLWAAVVAERLGFTHDEALTLGRAVAGLNAYSKGVSLGLIHPAPEAVREQRKKLRKGNTLTVALLGRAVPVVRTPAGLRALTKDIPDDPASVARYLEGKFGGAFPAVRTAMAKLADKAGPRADPRVRRARSENGGYVIYARSAGPATRGAAPAPPAWRRAAAKWAGWDPRARRRQRRGGGRG